MRPMLLPIELGAVLGGLFVLGARAWARGGERQTLALGLVVAAVISVAAWYPLLCVGFDLVVVGYLVRVSRPRVVQAYKLLILAIMAALGCSGRPDPATTPAPASSAAPNCAVGDTVLIRETLYFGRNRPRGGTVSEVEWRAFLAEVVTPRFPLGLTVQEATGQWKGANGSVEQEQSEIVTLFHPDNDAARRSVHEIALEYKRRFQQEAVLRERTPTCARFE
jgi:hypothetical protein